MNTQSAIEAAKGMMEKGMSLDAETAKKVAEEIEAREAGSVARITPQIEGGRVISRIGRM